ncbi:MAG: AMP-binding protein, partial [Anaerolineales bacterium]
MRDKKKQKILDYEPEALTLRDLICLRSSNGSKPLYIIRDEVLTYGDADARSNEVANKLLELGVQKGDVVATLMYNSVFQAVLWFGCAKIGAVYAPLNVSLEKDDLAYSLNDTDAKIFVIDEELAPAYNACQEKLDISPQLYVCGAISAIRSGDPHPHDDLYSGNSALPDV